MRLLHQIDSLLLAEMPALLIAGLRYRLKLRHLLPIVDTTVKPDWSSLASVHCRVAAGACNGTLPACICRISDIKFVSSVSRESISNILVRFHDIPERSFDKRVADLRREVQNAESELPDSSPWQPAWVATR